MDPKIPQNLEDYVYSIKSTKNKNKNKAHEYVSKSSVDSITKMNGSQIGENRKSDKNESIKGDESTGRKNFDVDLNGDQFPHIN
nr:hypothetical protein [Tanacetum cinerariifolium]